MPSSKIGRDAGRSGLSIEDFLELLQRTLARREQVPAAMARLAEVARRCDIPLASHDDDSPEMTASMHRLGCRICEFPLDETTARHAIAGGAAVIMGAPNILRGGSHCGRLDAAAAIAGGLSNVLTSDYYYPAMLQSVFRLVADAVLPLQQAWPLISGNAAAAAGLYDRGVLAPGKRADVVLVDDSDPALPQVVATFAGGRPVYATRDLTGTG
jgi:alpha-D-ribose 1-methylphosphonate 5-triphosphate diphosphatase